MDEEKERRGLVVLQVFAPPSAWTMALLNVLAELHQEPDLKLNLKFEIEVLSKALKVDLNASFPYIVATITKSV